MRHLLLMRHAKSAHETPGLRDHDRPLNDRGERDAPRMGERLREAGIAPELIISSTAVRALATANLFAQGNAYGGTVQTEKRLYLAGVDEFLEVLAEVDDAVQTVMLVAHNPGSEELLNHFTRDTREMPTAAIARISTAADTWADFARGPRAELSGYWIPKDA